MGRRVRHKQKWVTCPVLGVGEDGSPRPAMVCAQPHLSPTNPALRANSYPKVTVPQKH
jgi:hypothetical protein